MGLKSWFEEKFGTKNKVDAVTSAAPPRSSKRKYNPQAVPKFKPTDTAQGPSHLKSKELDTRGSLKVQPGNLSRGETIYKKVPEILKTQPKVKTFAKRTTPEYQPSPGLGGMQKNPYVKPENAPPHLPLKEQRKTWASGATKSAQGLLKRPTRK